MASCPCPNPDDEPDALCCPDPIVLADAVDGRDRTCKRRRIKPGTKGVLAAKNKKAGFLDGSAANPVNMDFEQVLASDGYMLIQTPSGRLLAVKPDATLAAANPVLQAVYQDGVIKFVPVSFSNQSINDAEVTDVKCGFLAALACAGDGKVRLGKFLPDCITVEDELRYLTVDANGRVCCDTKAIDACPAAAPATELDSLTGCVDGVETSILPVLGKRLSIVDSGGAKFALIDAVADTTYLAAPVNIFTQQKTTGPPVAVVTPHDLTAIVGWMDGFTEVMLDIRMDAVVISADYQADLKVDGVIAGSVLLVAAFGNSAMVNRGWYPIKTPGAIQSELTYAPGTPGTFSRFNCFLDVVAFK